MKKKCKKCSEIYIKGLAKCPKCLEKEYKPIFTFEDFKLLFFVIVFIVGLILIGISSCSVDDSSKEEEEELARKREYCSAKSNTYYKCSYSIWEGRCICKQR